MKLEKLKLTNYRQYKDCEIEFPRHDSRKHITVIEGVNGAGKTNILNAVTWCLYNKEMHLSSKNKGLPIVNNSALMNAKVDQVIQVVVEIDILDNERKRTIFKRTLSVRITTKEGGFVLVRDNANMLTVHYQRNNDYVAASTPDHRIWRFAPKEIHEYFFFDGERLNHYFTNPESDTIRDEVFNISQLSLFEKVITHLEARSNEYSKQLRDISPQAAEFKGLLDNTRTKIKEQNISLKKLQQERIKYEKKAEEIDSKLEGFPTGAEVKSLQEERLRKEMNVATWEKEIKSLEHELLDHLIEYAPLLLCHTAIHKAKQIISGIIVSGEIPPPIKINFLEELLKKGKCICHADISEGRPSRSNVENVLKECNEISEITEELIGESHELGSMLKLLPSFEKIRKQNNSDIVNKRNMYKEESKQLKILEDKLSNIGQPDIVGMERTRKVVKGKIHDKIEEITRIKVEIESLEKEEKDQAKAYDQHVRKITLHEALKKKLLFCQEAIKISREIKNGIMNEIRLEIEEKTNEQFLELIWKKGAFEKVNVDEKYNISVIDQNGQQALGTLSAGERQVLALSFMAALNMVSGFDTPIIIDTPLGRISDEPRKNIALNLHKYLSGKQVILLVTDAEYKDVRNELRDRVGIEYKIKFDMVKGGCKSEVRKYEK